VPVAGGNNIGIRYRRASRFKFTPTATGRLFYDELLIGDPVG
jgi:hypothetical protein